MRDIFTLFLHAIVTVIRLGRPGGLRSVVAESVLRRHQIQILDRGRKRAPNLRASDRIIAGLCTLLMRPARVLRSGLALKPSTVSLSQALDEAKVPAALFTQTSASAGSQRADERTDRCGRRNETAQSHLGLQANCSADRSRLRRRSAFPFLANPVEPLLSEDAARQIVAHILEEKKRSSVVIAPGSQHSSGVIAVDEQGNVASILHSINTELWGTTGIFVDGISIPDSAALQQEEIARAGPGNRLPEGTNPLIVLKHGKPFLASSAVGSGLWAVTLQNLINILDFGMDVGAVVQPNTAGPSRTNPEVEAVESGFSDSVLNGVRARSQKIEVLPDYQQNGYWVGGQINPLLSYRLTGAASRKLPSFVEGY